MRYNNQSEIFTSFHETGFNRIIRAVMRQRPSLFNYATADFVNNPTLLCNSISSHSAIKRFNNPLITEQPYLSIFNYGGQYGMSYHFQITDLTIDFHPTNLVNLPAKLSPLTTQSLALRAKICGGIACPSKSELQRIISQTSEKKTQALTGIPFEKDQVHCFCTEFYAKAKPSVKDNLLSMEINGFEIKDIRPAGLESSIECFVMTQLTLGLLPSIQLNLEEILGNIIIKQLPSLAIELASTNPNPSIQDHAISLFFNIEQNQNYNA